MYLIQHKIILCMLLISALFCALPCNSQINLASTVQKAWNTHSPEPIFSISILKHSKVDWQYYEFGGVFMIPFHSGPNSVMDSVKYQKEYDRSFYGLYGGYFVTVAPILRPGVLLGTLLTSKETYSSRNGTSYSHTSNSSLQMDYYAAFEIQSGIFTFIVSNKGIGGGLNVQF